MSTLSDQGSPITKVRRGKKPSAIRLPGDRGLASRAPEATTMPGDGGT